MKRDTIYTLSIIFSSFILQFKTEAVTWRSAISIVVTPLALLLVNYFLFRHQPEALAHQVLGTAMLGMWGMVSGNAMNDLRRERWEGTLEMLFSAPVSLETIIFGRSLANGAMGCMAVVLVLAIAVGLNVPVFAYPLKVAYAVSLFMAASICLGTLISVVYVLVRLPSGTGNLLDILVWTISGILFPLSLLPPWVLPLSFLSPLTWVMMSIEALFGRPSLLGWHWGITALTALGMSVAVLLLAQLLFQRVERRLRYTAELTYG